MGVKKGSLWRVLVVLNTQTSRGLKQQDFGWLNRQIIEFKESLSKASKIRKWKNKWPTWPTFLSYVFPKQLTHSMFFPHMAWQRFLFIFAYILPYRNSNTSQLSFLSSRDFFRTHYRLSYRDHGYLTKLKPINVYNNTIRKYLILIIFMELPLKNA